MTSPAATGGILGARAGPKPRAAMSHGAALEERPEWSRVRPGPQSGCGKVSGVPHLLWGDPWAPKRGPTRPPRVGKVSQQKNAVSSRPPTQRR